MERRHGVITNSKDEKGKEWRSEWKRRERRRGRGGEGGSGNKSACACVCVCISFILLMIKCERTHLHSFYQQLL